MAVFDLKSEVSAHVLLHPQAALLVTLADTGFSSDVVLERRVGTGAWSPVATLTAAVAAQRYVNELPDAAEYRLRAASFVPRQSITFSATPDGGDLNLDYDGSPVTMTHAGTASTLQTALRQVTGLEAVTVSGSYAAGFVVTFVGLAEAEVLTDDSSDLTASAVPVVVTIAELEVDYTLAAATDDAIEQIYRDKRSRVVLEAMDDGSVRAPGGLSGASLIVDGQAVPPNPNNIATSEAIATNGDAPTAIGLTAYQTQITSGGSEGSEDATIGDGTGAIVGQRKLLVFSTQTHASDVIALDHANIVNEEGAALDAATLDDEDAYLLLEWNGAKWQAIYYNGDVTLTAS